MKTRNVILALVGAATAGVIIGILVAPEKGSDLRNRITDRAGKFACDLGDLINTGMTQFAKMKGDVSDQVAGIEIGKKNRPTTNMI